MKYGLNDNQLELIKNILLKYDDIKEAYIFGSRAKGTFNDRSDIDITIKKSNITRKLINKIIMDFEESNLPYFVDINIYEEINNVNLKNQIDKCNEKIIG